MKVFVAYSFCDYKKVRSITDRLKKQTDKKFWIAQNEISFGENFEQSITDSIKQFDDFLIFLGNMQGRAFNEVNDKYGKLDALINSTGALV